MRTPNRRFQLPFCNTTAIESSSSDSASSNLLRRLSTAVPSLATEILAQIVSEAISHPLYTNEDHSKLLSRLCLVSKTFLSLARLQLYEVISLGFDDNNEEYPWYGFGYNSGSDSEKSEPEDPSSRGEQLVKFLYRFGHLRLLVRTLNVEFQFYEDSEKAIDAQNVVLALFKLCQKVTHVKHYAQGALAEDLLELLAGDTAARPVLGRMEDLDTLWCGEGAAQLLAATPRLHKLVLRRESSGWWAFKDLDPSSSNSSTSRFNVD